ncbi:MAG: ABC transporter substrate-binding protein, partial [Halobacteriales archaeon]
MSHYSTTRRKVLKATGGLAAFGVASTAGCLGGNSYAIGMANPVSGSLDTFGQRNQRGKELAVADVNDVGLRGGELEIIEEDTKSVEQDGISAAQKLVNQDGVPVVIGAVGSAVSLAIYESVIQDTDVEQISQNSTSPGLSEHPELMRMSPPGKAQAGAIADLVEGDDHGSVAVAYVNNAYGQGVAEVFRESFDGEVAYFEAHNQGESSYSNVVTGMDEAGADAWVFVTYQPEFTTMATEAFNQGVTDVPLYGADSVKGPDVLEQAPEDFLEGMKAVIPSAALTQDNYQEFASTFEEEFDQEPTAWATYAYDGIVTAAIAAHAADDFS